MTPVSAYEFYRRNGRVFIDGSLIEFVSYEDYLDYLSWPLLERSTLERYIYTYIFYGISIILSSLTERSNEKTFNVYKNGVFLYIATRRCFEVANGEKENIIEQLKISIKEKRER